MSGQEFNPKRTGAAPDDGDAQMFADVKLLDRAAREWRWLAWLWLAGAVILSLPLFVRLLDAVSRLDAANPAGLRVVAQAGGGLVVLWLLLSAVAGLYFLLARRMERGQRWAVGLALLIAALAGAGTATRLCFRVAQQQWAISIIVMDFVLLVAHLNLIKTLFQCYQATGRIRSAADAAMEISEP